MYTPLRSLSYNRSTASSKAQFLFQFPVSSFSLSSSSSCLRLLFVIPSLLFLLQSFLLECILEDSSYETCDQSNEIILSSLTLYNTLSFLTRSLQMLSSILLQHHISKLFTYFWSTFRSVQILGPQNCYAANVAIDYFLAGVKSLLPVRCCFATAIRFWYPKNVPAKHWRLSENTGLHLGPWFSYSFTCLPPCDLKLNLRCRQFSLWWIKNM